MYPTMIQQQRNRLPGPHIERRPNQIVCRLAILMAVITLTVMGSIIAVSFCLTLSSTSPMSAAWTTILLIIACIVPFTTAMGSTMGAGLRMRNTRYKSQWMLGIMQRFEEDFKTKISWQRQHVQGLMQGQAEAYHYSLFNQVQNVSIYGGTFNLMTAPPPQIYSLEDLERPQPVERYYQHPLRQRHPWTQADSDIFDEIFAIVREISAEIEATFGPQRKDILPV